MSHRATSFSDNVGAGREVEYGPVVTAPESAPAARHSNFLKTAIVASVVLLVTGGGALFAWMSDAPSTDRRAAATASSAEVASSVQSQIRVAQSTPAFTRSGSSEAGATLRFDSDTLAANELIQQSQADRLAGQSLSESTAPVSQAGSVPRTAAMGAQQSESEAAARVDRRSGEASTGGTNAGGVIADFDPLIELIENTIEVDTWDPVGPGTMQEFESGVRIDPSGLMQLRRAEDGGRKLDAVRESLAEAETDSSHAQPVLGASSLRKVSLLRLMGEVRRHLDRQEPLPEAVRYLGGLTAIRYVFVYPEPHDLVLAGPAEAWRRDAFGRPVGASTGKAILELDDLMTLIQALDQNESVGCSIDPRASGLKKFREHLVASRGPVPFDKRDAWVEELRDQLGVQDISVWGAPAGSRVARVLVEADYRMKLIGFDLAPSVAGIPSYFDLLAQQSTVRRKSLESLRWWFTLNYDSVTSNAAETAFEVVGSPVQLLSENEFLTAMGRRVHTGRSEATNTLFARNFTDHFGELADADPVFSALGGVFNLAVVAALIEEHGLAQRVGWPATWLAHRYPTAQGRAPETVESVMNVRAFSSREFTAAVSGGVSIEPGALVGELVSGDDEALVKQHRQARRAPHPDQPWWWD